MFQTQQQLQLLLCIILNEITKFELTNVHLFPHFFSYMLGKGKWTVWIIGSISSRLLLENEQIASSTGQTVSKREKKLLVWKIFKKQWIDWTDIFLLFHTNTCSVFHIQQLDIWRLNMQWCESCMKSISKHQHHTRNEIHNEIQINFSKSTSDNLKKQEIQLKFTLQSN